MTTNYTVTTELAVRAIDDDGADEILERYAGHAPVVATSPRGWVEVTASFDALTMAEAVVLAHGLAPDPIVSMDVMTSREFDRRGEHVPPVPELLSVAQTAERLGVTRAAVTQRIERGSLPHVRIGRNYAVPAAAVHD